MDKTIIVGVGGTGLETIRALRRRVVEAHGSLDALPQLGFFYIDTDPKETKVTEDKRKEWEVLGQSIQLSNEEFFIVAAPDLGPILSNLDAYPNIKPWFPVEELRSIDQATRDNPGARQIRSLGRLALTLKVDAIEQKFTALYSRLPQAAGGGETHVYLVCSLSGGTGSGMFLDLGYLLRQWSGGTCQTRAFLVFPELTAGRGPRYLANAYAALKELNYLDVGLAPDGGVERPIQYRLPHRDRPVTGRPFDFCYIVSPHNDANVEVGLDETLPDMIAHRIFLDFDSAFADNAASNIQNAAGRVMKLRDPFNGNVHSQNFFTFGLSSIQYPIDRITEMVASQIAHDVVDGWLKPRVTPGNINEHVQAYLPDFHVTDEYLLGHKDFFGKKADFQSHEREVEQFVSELRQKTPQQNIVPFLGDQQRQFLDTYRSVGFLKFYQDKRDNLDGAVKEVVRAISSRVSALLLDPALGYDFAAAVLVELLRVLNVKHQHYLDTFNGLPGKEKTSRTALTGFYNQATDAERKMIGWLRDRAIKEAMTKVADAMKVNLTATIGIKAYEFGREVLARLIEEVQALRDRLADWRNETERVRQELAEEVARRKNHLQKKQANIKEFNGELLFRPDAIKSLYQELDVDAAMRYVQERVLGARGDILAASSVGEDVAQAFYKEALDWILNRSQVRLAEKNVAQKLLEEIPDTGTRRATLSRIFRKSAPFLVFDDAQKALKAGEDGIGYRGDPTANAKLGALLDDQAGALKEVATIKSDLGMETGLKGKSISKISDTHQLLFLQEITAFPLRLVKDLAFLKEHYDEHTRRPNIPLHSQKRFDPPLMDLFVTTTDEVRAWEEVEEAFLIAWFEGKLRVEKNLREGLDEIRYRYVELGSDAYVRVGATWEEAFASFFAPGTRAQELRDQLVKDIRAHLKAFDNFERKRQLCARLTSHLAGIKASAELREEDPWYQRFDRIRKRVIERQKLPFESVPVVVEPSGAAAPVRPGLAKDVAAAADAHGPAAEAVAKYEILLRTSLRNGKGKLTPAMVAMLKNRQTAAGIPDSQAQQLLERLSAEFGRPSPADQYRAMFESFFEDGEISEDERVLLIEQQVDLGLGDDEVAGIEASVIRKRQESSGV